MFHILTDEQDIFNRSQSKDQLCWGLSAGVCLTIGIGIYLLFRSRQHLVFTLIDALGLGSLIDSMRAMVADITLPDFVLFSLPDGMWASAYILIIDHIFQRESLCSRLSWASFIPIVGAGSELLQLAGLVPGTFDSFDLVAYLLPLLIYGITILTLAKNKQILL